MKLLLVFMFVLVVTQAAALVLEKPVGYEETLPVVMWHGMGDNCCHPGSMGNIKKMIEAELGDNAYVLSLMIGDTPSEDTDNGFLLNVNQQIDMVCEQLRKDARLKNGFNAVGFSQGAQFLRGYVERCNMPPVHNLISIGGQHQGVSDIPRCSGHSMLCTQMRALLGIAAYTEEVQKNLVQAEYWHDPSKEEEYRNKCIYLPDINNDKVVKNVTYKLNLASLNRFVMLKFLNDTMVVPSETSWFGWYRGNSTNEIVSLQETPLYKE
eukprot:Ihof_evm17s77 gene=Ihof_evmTU17s77